MLEPLLISGEYTHVNDYANTWYGVGGLWHSYALRCDNKTIIVTDVNLLKYMECQLR